MPIQITDVAKRQLDDLKSEHRGNVLSALRQLPAAMAGDQVVRLEELEQPTEVRVRPIPSADRLALYQVNERADDGEQDLVVLNLLAPDEFANWSVGVAETDQLADWTAPPSTSARVGQELLTKVADSRS